MMHKTVLAWIICTKWLAVLPYVLSVRIKREEDTTSLVLKDTTSYVLKCSLKYILA